MKSKKEKLSEPTRLSVHFIPPYLLNPANPVTVNLIGAGGTGSQILTSLARINHALLALDHPGLFVRLFDSKRVTPANQGRQLFAESEIGMNKAVALINRTNRFFGTRWQAIPGQYDRKFVVNNPGGWESNLMLTCVDTVEARFEIASTLSKYRGCTVHLPVSPTTTLYWMDCGNSQHTGQVFLSTIRTVKQPESEKYNPVAVLPLFTDEYRDLLIKSGNDDKNLPSCSLAEALTKQDLFINTAVALQASNLLWQMFTEGFLRHRGAFINLKQARTQPIPLLDKGAKVITPPKPNPIEKAA